MPIILTNTRATSWKSAIILVGEVGYEICDSKCCNNRNANTSIIEKESNLFLRNLSHPFLGMGLICQMTLSELCNTANIVVAPNNVTPRLIIAAKLVNSVVTDFAKYWLKLLNCFSTQNCL